MENAPAPDGGVDQFVIDVLAAIAEKMPFRELPDDAVLLRRLRHFADDVLQVIGRINGSIDAASILAGRLCELKEQREAGTATGSQGERLAAQEFEETGRDFRGFVREFLHASVQLQTALPDELWPYISASQRLEILQSIRTAPTLPSVTSDSADAMMSLFEARMSIVADRTRVFARVIKGLADQIDLRLARCGSESTGASMPQVPLKPREQNVLEALGDEELSGEELAAKSGYSFNGSFREMLSDLKKRGYLVTGSAGRGYRRRPSQ